MPSVTSLTGLFPGGFDAKKHASFEPSTPPEFAFADALSGFGMEVDGPIIAGDIQRTRMVDQKRGNKRNGWYLYFGMDPVTNIAAGVYGDWRHDQRQYWSSKSERDMDVREHTIYQTHVKAMQAKVEAEKKARQDEASQEATDLVASLPLAANHDYLFRKKVKPYGLYIDGTALVIPLRDIDGNIRSLQRIYQNGEKRFLAGGQIKGCFHLIGSTLTEPTYLVEGYATGATIHEVTGKSVVVAFNSGNLAPALEAIRANNSHKIIIAADNDQKTEGNPGLTAAKKAAENHIGVSVIYPKFNGTEGTDFNDLMTAEGPEAVNAILYGDVSSKSKLKLTRVTDMDLAKPIDYLIDDFLVEETTSLIWGPPGCGKSFIAIDMGLHIATGESWHGHDVSQGDVIYVCGEGFNGIPLRVGAWRDHHDYTDPIPFYMTHEAVPIAKDGAVQFLISAIKDISESPKLIIIDTLNRNFGGGNESDQEDMDLYLDASHLLVQELKCNVLTVHHSGKDPTKGPRGSTGLPGAVYSNMEMCKPRDGEWSLITHKQKDGPEAPPISIELVGIQLGEAEDNRGRIRNISSLVVKVVDDISIGATIAANITGRGKRKKLTANQQLLINTCREQTKNIPTDKPITVDKKQLFSALKVVGFDGSRRSEAMKWAKDKGVLEPISATNESILVFKDPVKNYG